MSQRLLGSRIDAVAVRREERSAHARCTLSWWIDSPAAMPYGVRTEGPWGTVEGRDRDLYGALNEVRRQVEAAGWLLAINGARPDVHQSGMLRSSGSSRAYQLRPGAPADDDTMVDLFADAPGETVTSVEAQATAYTQWLESL
ncbi:hypothetical protein ACIOJD_00080 [Streptomyces sp. NPDC088116]|uniref:hypothetical protein n=1 Tax=Streptomyces sp. NPDC088116 TaxID=3365825 RepID=UPI0037FD60E1